MCALFLCPDNGMAASGNVYDFLMCTQMLMHVKEYGGLYRQHKTSESALGQWKLTLGEKSFAALGTQT